MNVEKLRDQLRRAKVRTGVDPDMDAALLAGAVPSLARAVLDGMQTPEGAIEILDYAVSRAVR